MYDEGFENAVDSTVKQWGGSLAIRLPKSIVEALQLQAEDAVHLKARGSDTLIIRKRGAGEETKQEPVQTNCEILDALNRFEQKVEGSIDQQESLYANVQEATEKLFNPFFEGVATRAFFQLVDLAILHSDTGWYQVTVSGDQQWFLVFTGAKTDLTATLQRPVRSGKEVESLGNFRLTPQPYGDIRITYEPLTALHHSDTNYLILELTLQFLEDVSAELLSTTVANQIKQDFNL